MFRRDAAPPLFEQEPVQVARDGAADIIDFAWVFLYCQYPIILLCALLGVSAEAIRTPPQYTANTNLIVEARRGRFLQQQSILADAPTDTGWIAKIVKLENVAGALLFAGHNHHDGLVDPGVQQSGILIWRRRMIIRAMKHAIPACRKVVNGPDNAPIRDVRDTNPLGDAKGQFRNRETVD